MRAWHWLPEDRRLRYGDGRMVRPGETYRHEGAVELCRSGMHASVGALDALSYAPGPIVCRVELRGEVVRGDDKVVASERHVLWTADATPALHRFARACALDVVHLWDAPPVVMRYLRTGDESLRAAASAASSDATWAAARNAAWDAARAAAWAAASAAWDAARDAQSRRLHRMLMALPRETA